MARGVQISFTLNPREFIRGLKTIESGTDEVKDALDTLEDTTVDLDTDKAEKELDGLGDAAKDAGDDIERHLEDGADDAEAAFRSLGRRFSTEMDDVEREARGAARDVDQAFDKVDVDTRLNKNIRGGSFRGAAGALAAEAGDEFIESWGEAIREGNPAGVIRELFSNAALIGAAAAGPIGAGVGLAVSFVTSFIDQTADERERFREAVDSLFGSVDSAELSGKKAAEAFRRGYVEESQIGDEVAQAFGVESAAEGWQRVADLAAQTQLPAKTVTEAVLGQAAALADVQAALGQNEQAYNTNRDAAGQVFDTDRARYDEIVAQNDILDDQKAGLSDLLGISRTQLDANKQALDNDRTKRDVLRGIKSEQQQVTASAGKNAGNAREAAEQTGRIKDNVRNTPDLNIKARVDTREIDNIPRTRNITLTANVRGATAKAQRLLDSGVL